MRRPTLHAILALLLVAVFAAPVEAAGAAADGRETLTGHARGATTSTPQRQRDRATTWASTCGRSTALFRSTSRAVARVG